MEGTVTISLTEYNSMRDSITELQSLSEKYAEQIQKEQLSNITVREWAINEMTQWEDFNEDKCRVVGYRRKKLIELGITNEEIDAYLKKVNT